MNIQRITALLIKEFGQLVKDKRMLPIVFVAPVLQLTFLGYAASLDVKNISMLVCDLDKSHISRDFISTFTNAGYFSIEYATDDYSEVQEFLDRGKVTMALVLPPKFGDRVLRRGTGTVPALLGWREGKNR